MAATPTDTPPVPEDASPETHQPDAAHHDPTTTTAALRTIDQRREQRRVVAGTIIGTSIEWYDFFLYASAAGLVFGQLFFQPLGPQAAVLVSFLTVG